MSFTTRLSACQFVIRAFDNVDTPFLPQQALREVKMTCERKSEYRVGVLDQRHCEVFECGKALREEHSLRVSTLIVLAIRAFAGLTFAGFYVLQWRLARFPSSLLDAGLGAVGLLLVLCCADDGISSAALAALLVLSDR